MAHIVEHFEQTALSGMKLSSQVVVDRGTTVHDTVMAMANADTSCAFVMDGESITGIFTEHDVTHRVVAAPDVWGQTVEAHMTPDPHVIGRDASAMDALRKMRSGGFRNLPVVLDDEGRHANVTHYDLILLASLFLQQEPEEDDVFSAEHALRHVDFYGMPSRVPLEFGVDATLGEIVRSMQQLDRGLATIVDDRGVVIGEFTQHDIFRKVACRVEELDDHVIESWMTTVWAAASPTTPIADGLNEMAAKRHRYLLLTNETGRCLGIVTFRDIAEFFEAAFTV